MAILSPEIIELIKSFESFSPTPYHCSSGKLTVGYGETELVSHGIVLNEPIAAYLLRQRLLPYAGNMRIALGDVNPRCIDAFVSLAYNCTDDTLTAILKSRCYRAFQAAVDGDKDAWPVCFHEFLDWNKGGDGAIAPGLVRRRKAELHWWLKGKIKLDGYNLDQPYLVE